MNEHLSQKHPDSFQDLLDFSEHWPTEDKRRFLQAIDHMITSIHFANSGQSSIEGIQKKRATDNFLTAVHICANHCPASDIGDIAMILTRHLGLDYPKLTIAVRERWESGDNEAFPIAITSQDVRRRIENI